MDAKNKDRVIIQLYELCRDIENNKIEIESLDVLTPIYNGLNGLEHTGEMILTLRLNKL